MPHFAYPYVGPDAARGGPLGTLINTRDDLTAWLAAHRESVATFVVDLDGRLRVAPRRSEHVACAGGEAVLSAGELFFAPGPRIARASNHSSGYCPDVDSFDALAEALRAAGLEAPSGFDPAIVFRRCTRCGERSIVKEQWFVCPFCDADLPTEWNVTPRRCAAPPAR